MFKPEKKPVNAKRTNTTSPGLTKSESAGSSSRSLQRKDNNRSLRIVMPVMNEGEINSIKSSQAIMKKLISTINNY